MAVPEQITLDPLKVTLDPLPQKITLDPLPQKQPGPIDRFLLGAKERAAKFGAEFKVGRGPESAIELWTTESLPANIVKGAARVGEKSWKSLVREQQKELDVMTGRAKGPDHASMLEELKSLGVTAEQHPGLLVGSLVKGLITDPELLLPWLWKAIPDATALKVAQAARAMGASATAAQAAEALGKVTGRMAVGGAAGGAVEGGKQFSKGDYDLGDIGKAAGESALMSAPGPFKVKPKVNLPIPTAIPRNPAQVVASTIGATEASIEQATRDDPVTPQMLANITAQAPPTAAQSTANLVKTIKRAAVGSAVSAGVGYSLAGKDQKAVGAEAGAIAGAFFPLLKGVKHQGHVDIAELVNARNGQVQSVIRHLYQFQRKIEDLVPDKAMRERIAEHIDTGTQPAAGTPEHEAYTSLVQFFADIGALAKKEGVVDQLRDDYISHIVEDDPKDPWYKRFFGRQPGGSGTGAKPFGMERRWDTFQDLQQAIQGSGLKLKTKDASEIAGIYGNAVYRAIANRRLLESVKQVRLANGGAIVMPADQAPRGWHRLPSPSLSGLAFHPDIAADMKFVFGSADPNAAVHYLHALTSSTKRVTVSFSLFHAKTLVEGFLLAKKGSLATGLGVSDIRAALKMFREGGNNDAVDKLIKGGLMLSTPEDVAGHEVQHFLDKIGDAMNAKFPLKGLGVGALAKGAAAVDKGVERLTFGHMQTGMKIITAMQQYETLLRSGIPEEQAAKSAAAFANDVFGSLDWYRVATDTESHILRSLGTATLANNGRKILQILMFAPDWTFATFRSMARSLPGGTDAITQQLYRRYLLKAAMYYLTVGSAVNYAFSGHSIFDNDNPTRIELPDGRTMQFAKHETEPLDWLRHPVETYTSKYAFGPRVISETQRSHDIAKAYKKPSPTPFEDIERTATEMAPISLQQFIQNGFDAEAVGGALGFPIYGKKLPPHVPVQPERGEQ